jgi:GNAT superfamily N-acetyltransferase
VTRLARDDDAQELLRIEQASMETFAGAGIELPSFVRATIVGDPLIVVLLDDVLVGYASIEPLGGWWHLHEVSVDPLYGRRGAGTVLLLDVIARAHRAQAVGVSLTTFADLPFNGPWYARHGFEVVEENAHPWLAAAREFERSAGIEVAPRQAMVRHF